MGDSTVMLSTCAPLSVNSAKHLAAHCDRPLAAWARDTPFLLFMRYEKQHTK